MILDKILISLTTISDGSPAGTSFSVTVSTGAVVSSTGCSGGGAFTPASPLMAFATLAQAPIS